MTMTYCVAAKVAGESEKEITLEILITCEGKICRALLPVIIFFMIGQIQKKGCDIVPDNS